MDTTPSTSSSIDFDQSAEIARLTQALAAREAQIERAPHHGFCSALYAKEWSCTCWKSEDPEVALAQAGL